MVILDKVDLEWEIARWDEVDVGVCGPFVSLRLALLDTSGLGAAADTTDLDANEHNVRGRTRC